MRSRARTRARGKHRPSKTARVYRPSIPGAGAASGTPTGAQLTYDNEGRLSTWQNAPTSPTTTDSFVYDGEGQRVQQQVIQNGSITTTTVYVGSLEEITGSTLTKYPGSGAMRVGNTLSYVTTDGLGSVSEALDGSGNVTFQQLFAPYGGSRYSSGTSPTSYAFTGQRADSTGPDYYNARYYDPVAGQFVSADTVQDGLNRYGYVHGNPETATDPTGHSCIVLDGTIFRCGSGPTTTTTTTTTTPCKGDNCRDTHGKCNNYATCDKDKAAAALKLQNDYNFNEGVGGLLVLLGSVALAIIDKNDIPKEVLDLINLFVAVVNLLPNVMAAIFGSGSAAASVASFIVTGANSALGVLRGVQVVLNGLMGFNGFIEPALKGAGLVLDALGGPINMGVSEVVQLFGTAVLQGGIAWGYQLLNQAQDELGAIFAISGETVPQWCDNNSGACGAGMGTL